MEVFRQVMETNFFGGLRCIKAVIPSMREHRSRLHRQRKFGCRPNSFCWEWRPTPPPNGHLRPSASAWRRK